MNWFSDWAERHRQRCPRHDWPAEREARRAMFGAWKSEFQAARVTEAEAEAASLAMVANPPAYLDRHLPALMGKIREARRNAAQAGVHGHYDDVELARAACRECPQCDGNGLVSVDGPDAGKPPEERGRPPRMTVAAYCGCGLGNLIKRIHLEKEPRLACRFRQAPWLGEVVPSMAEAVPF